MYRIARKPGPPLWCASMARQRLIFAFILIYGASLASFIEGESCAQWTDDHFCDILVMLTKFLALRKLSMASALLRTGHFRLGSVNVLAVTGCKFRRAVTVALHRLHVVYAACSFACIKVELRVLLPLLLLLPLVCDACVWDPALSLLPPLAAPLPLSRVSQLHSRSLCWMLQEMFTAAGRH